MDNLVPHKKGAFLVLNIIWSILTAIILVFMFYSVWHHQKNEIAHQAEKTAEVISNHIDNLIDTLMQKIIRLPLQVDNLNQCTKELLPSLKLLLMNTPQIAGLAIINDRKHIVCSTLPPKVESFKTLADSRGLALFGPFKSKYISQPILIIQQRLNNDSIQIYVLESEFIKLLKTKTPRAETISLYDQEQNTILLQISRDIASNSWSNIADPNQQLNIQDQDPKTFDQHPLIRLDGVYVLVKMDKNILSSMAFPIIILVVALIFLISTFLYLYLRSLVHQHFSLHRAIVNSIKHNDFFPVYQPIMDRRTNCSCGAEVLLRWQAASEEIIMPDYFIEYAEQSGLIIPITIQLCKKAFMDCSKLLQKSPSFHLSINLSSIHFTEPKFFVAFIRLCKQYNIPFEQIILEVTERDLLQNDLSLVSKMVELRKSGFSIAVDDFGTGHASISYLQRFPFNYLKIDRLFVSAIGSGAVTESLSQSIIEMSTRLGLNVIAEGVETYQQVESLENNGAFLMQGWYFSKALRYEKFIQFIKRTS